MIELILFAIAAAAFGGAATVALSVRISMVVSDWLRARGLRRSQLMDAVIRLESIGNGIKTVFRLSTAELGTVEHRTTETLRLSEIDVPEVRQALLARGVAEFSALPYLTE